MSDTEALLAPWQRHNARLCLASVFSMAASVGLWIAAATPDGRDAWYAAIAIEFFIWGAIDLFFAIGGFRGVAAIRSMESSERRAAAVAKNQQISRALAINTWLNVLWLTTGAGLLTWGYLAWSASLVGHGVGVLLQAVLLTVLDSVFARELHRTISGEASNRSAVA